MGAEIDEQTEPIPCGIQIVQYLRPVFVDQAGQCFDFQNDPAVADKVRPEVLLQNSASIFQLKFGLCQKWNALLLKLKGEAFLINGFRKPAAHPVMNGEAGTHDRVAFFRVDQLRHLNPLLFEVANELHEFSECCAVLILKIFIRCVRLIRWRS